jgi:enoyl-CoA hydratase
MAESTPLPSLTTLSAKVQDGVARVGLCRPEVRNAINLAMVEEMTMLLNRFAHDPTVSALILCGEGGREFASGADIAELRARTSTESMLAINARMFQAVEDFPRPTIAAVTGYALGGGLELALACDLRVMARNARVGLPEVKLGIYPAAGGTWRLPRLVGLGRAKEMVFTGRILSGEEAYELGLCERLCDEAEVETTAFDLASQIAKNAPLAVHMAKLSFHAAARGSDPTVAERLGQALLFDSVEKQQRMDEFLSRSKSKEPKDKK